MGQEAACFRRSESVTRYWRCECIFKLYMLCSYFLGIMVIMTMWLIFPILPSRVFSCPNLPQDLLYGKRFFFIETAFKHQRTSTFPITCYNCYRCLLYILATSVSIGMFTWCLIFLSSFKSFFSPPINSSKIVLNRMEDISNQSKGTILTYLRVNLEEKLWISPLLILCQSVKVHIKTTLNGKKKLAWITTMTVF